MENKASVITLVSRANLSITGLEKVYNVSEAQIVLDVAGSKMIISGQKLFVQKLDVENGIIEIFGTIDGIKYTQTKEKGSFLKRIFK